MGGGCELLSLLRRCTGGPVADDRRVDVVLDSGELVASYECRAYTLLLKLEFTYIDVRRGAPRIRLPGFSRRAAWAVGACASCSTRHDARTNQPRVMLFP